MIQRCSNPNNGNYKNYGARGIKVCRRWLSFKGFLEDMGSKPELSRKMTLERINNNLGYSKENCQWADYYQQGRNRRTNVVFTAFGVTACLSLLAEQFGVVGYNTVIYRLRRGWEIERALTEPKMAGNHTPKTFSEVL